jgi:hypothetical protein
MNYSFNYQENGVTKIDNTTPSWYVGENGEINSDGSGIEEAHRVLDKTRLITRDTSVETIYETSAMPEEPQPIWNDGRDVNNEDT